MKNVLSYHQLKLLEVVQSVDWLGITVVALSAVTTAVVDGVTVKGQLLIG